MRLHSKSPLAEAVRPAEGEVTSGSGSARELGARIGAMLATSAGSRARALAAVLSERVTDVAGYEGSVRRMADGALRAGRMMIERASREVLDAIAAALQVDLPPSTDRWIEAAGREGVPLITGWDLRGGGRERCVKLYVNASDASVAARAQLSAALAPGGAMTEPPAVIGMNARADGAVEVKLYAQSSDALALARTVGGPAVPLAESARAEDADAGGVLSFDAGDGAPRARAFFVALREPPRGTDWRSVVSLPGYDLEAIRELLPFAPASPRSVGISLSDGGWTLYAKPLGSGRAPEALEPAAIFRAGAAEVGVFVEPTEHAARAFRRTERHAVSIRVRDGDPQPLALESLVDWFASRLSAAERDGADLEARVADPPPPWRIVHPAGARS
jgi:hypothetical protein